MHGSPVSLVRRAIVTTRIRDAKHSRGMKPSSVLSFLIASEEGIATHDKRFNKSSPLLSICNCHSKSSPGHPKGKLIVCQSSHAFRPSPCDRKFAATVFESQCYNFGDVFAESCSSSSVVNGG
jgi:hypothetical protein